MSEMDESETEMSDRYGLFIFWFFILAILVIHEWKKIMKYLNRAMRFWKKVNSFLKKVIRFLKNVIYFLSKICCIVVGHTAKKRTVIIDGSNVAYGHGGYPIFSVKGIDICLKYFEEKGFEAKAVCPRKRLQQKQSTDPDRLNQLVCEKKVLPTPCKNLPGLRTTSYDDRFILECAEKDDAVIISNDNYADLLNEKPSWNNIIRTRVIGFTWFKDHLMLPKDPYGRHGPSLEEILNNKKR